jgi:hypothetical protein
MEPQKIIETQELTKRYGRQTAVGIGLRRAPSRSAGLIL